MNHAIKRRYLSERIVIFAIIFLLLMTTTAVILILPYESTYLRESGAEKYYLIVFIWLAAFSIAVFILGTLYNVLVWMEGRLSESERDAPKSRKLILSVSRFFRAILSREFGMQLKVFLFDSVLLQKLLKTSRIRWFLHSMILLGFLGILVLDIVATLALEIFHLESFSDPIGWGKLWIRDFGFDLFGLMILIGLIGAIIRRFVFRPKQLVTGQEDVVAVLLLLAVVLGGFIQEGLGMNIGLVSHSSPDAYSFVGATFATILPIVSVETYAQLWLLHAVLSLALIAYIPFSKLFHLFAAPLANQVDAIVRRRESNLGR